MNPTEFKGQNVIFAKDQPEYLPLPALKLPDGMVITCWEMTDEEFEELSKTRKVYVSQLTFNMPLTPLSVQTGLDGFIKLEEG